MISCNYPSKGRTFLAGKNLLGLLLFLAPFLSSSQTSLRSQQSEKDFVKSNFQFAGAQLKKTLAETENGPKSFPRTTDRNGKLLGSSMEDWTTGFFPGSLWMTADFNKDTTLESAAIAWTEKLEPLKFYTKNHDLGFMMYCSFGNAYRLTNNKAYKEVLIQSAKSLCTRYNPAVGCIKSWNTFRSWHGNATYNFPVIIDNMMNLELLFFASKETGDTMYRHIAVSHALHTMQNQIRSDYSSYHVVCYDSLSSKVVARETAQGYADNSTWSRGQAWGIYGFTMCYRETKDKRFLKTAAGMADWYINNKNLPTDKISYWDFNAGEPGYTPGINSKALKTQTNPILRDASAAAITASALLELSRYVNDKKTGEYRNIALQIIHTLSGPDYKAAPGTNGGFLLKHCVGSIPHGAEVDEPLVYADYYYLEALKRYHDWYLK